jgi:large subunit ribosomal protein L1
MKRSKKYLAVSGKVERSKKYGIEEAMKMLPEISFSKFPGSVNVLIFLNLNDKQKKEAIRGSYTLPNAFGKSIKVLAVADKSEAEKAKDADIFGGEELFKDIESGKLSFDVVITTPMMMPKLARLGKFLGTKGLMPNPKNGTITTDIASTIAKFKQGMKNFKSSNGAPISAVVGKTDMPADKLSENFNAYIKAVMGEVKKFGTNPIKSVTVTPTMGPKISIDVMKLPV